MRRADQIFDQIVETAKRSLSLRGVGGGNTDLIICAVAVGVAEAVFDTLNSMPPPTSPFDDPMPAIHDRFEKFGALLKLLGDQVAEHNAALLMLTAPQETAPRFVTCYCGWRHVESSTCVVCGRFA